MSDEKRNVGDLYEQDGDVYLMTAKGGLVKLTDTTTSETTGQRYLASLNACFDKMRERCGTTATITTTCARCSATIDPAAVEQHHERCFVVGDWVRWEYCGDWAEAQILAFVTISGGRRVAEVRVSSRRKGPCTTTRLNVENLRHIRRPGNSEMRSVEAQQNTPSGPLFRCQGYRDGQQCETRSGPPAKMGWYCPEHQPTLSARLGHLKHGPGGSGLAGPCDADCRKCEIERNTTRAGRIQAITELAYDGKITGEQARELLTSPDLEPLAPTLYDGLTAEECLDLMQRRQREATNSQFLTITHAQLTAARDLWSQQLKQRISAAKERERLSVTYCEVDVEDEPW